MKWNRCQGKVFSAWQCTLDASHVGRFPHSASNMVAHGMRELMIIGEDKTSMYGLMTVIQAFADMGHSGGSASVAVPMITKLLSYEPLTPITDDPEEWIHHGPEVWGGDSEIWQNIRNARAMSEDRGKTYRLVGSSDWNMIHSSNPANMSEIQSEGGEVNEREPGIGTSGADSERDA